MAEPVQVYRVRPRSPAMGERDGRSQQSLPLPDKPSIAVLPFTNMSAEGEQDFFADGLTEDLITELSAMPLSLPGTLLSHSGTS